jgi:hypothetical protein
MISQAKPGKLMDLCDESFYQFNFLDAQRSSETADAVVRLGTILVDEDATVAAIAKKSAALFAEVVRCIQPTGGLFVKAAEFLQ